MVPAIVTNTANRLKHFAPLPWAWIAVDAAAVNLEFCSLRIRVRCQPHPMCVLVLVLPDEPEGFAGMRSDQHQLVCRRDALRDLGSVTFPPALAQIAGPPLGLVSSAFYNFWLSPRQISLLIVKLMTWENPD